MTRRITRGFSKRAIVEEMAHKASITMGGRVRECCRDEANMLTVVDDDDLDAGRMVQVCKRCRSRHIRLRADSARMHAEPTPIKVPSFKVRERLGL
jgi:hypothetical protein